jgi:hypothetical protein
MTHEELLQSRAAAGAAYAAALEAYADAWIELQAHDLAVNNTNVRGNSPSVPTFLNDGWPHLTLHLEFSTEPVLPHILRAQATARHAQLIASLA